LNSGRVTKGIDTEEQNLGEQDLDGKLALACEVIEHRLTAIWSAVDAIDTKTNIALGFASTILVLLAGFYALGSREWPLPSLVLFGLALVAYIVVVVLSLLAYRTKAWSYRPDMSTLLQHCKDQKYSTASYSNTCSYTYTYTDTDPNTYANANPDAHYRQMAGFGSRGWHYPCSGNHTHQ